MKNIIIGNWKLNKNIKESNDFISEFKSLLALNKTKINCEYGVAPTFTSLSVLAQSKPPLELVAQNVNANKSGAFTGEVSIDMLREISVKYIIIGHSERRAIFKEDDNEINLKLRAILENFKKPILCIGETLSEFENNKTKEVVKKQLVNNLKGVEKSQAKNIVIAYEPIWAIGTGKTATSDIAQNICKYIRSELANLFGNDISSEIRIQYGGSVNPNNIEDILSQPDINGALVGGASLDPKSFVKLLTLN